MGDETIRLVPTRLVGCFWATVSDGGGQTCAISVGGALFCWGNSNRGQVGYGGQTDQPVPVRIGTRVGWAQPGAGGAHSCGVRTGHGLLCWGWNDSGQLGLGATGRKLVRLFALRARPGYRSVVIGNDADDDFAIAQIRV